MAQALDKQIQEYLPLLGNDEKKSLISVIKSFLSLQKKGDGNITIEEYNKELDEALARVKSGAYDTQEEVEKEASEW